MKASFCIRDARILIEASVGDLFVPLGPDLVECVCAVVSRRRVDGTIEPALPHAARLNPDAPMPVVVLACRVGPDEPEYYPPGFQTLLQGATPIVFLEQEEALAMRAKAEAGDASPAEDRPGADSVVNALLDVSRPELASQL